MGLALSDFGYMNRLAREIPNWFLLHRRLTHKDLNAKAVSSFTGHSFAELAALQQSGAVDYRHQAPNRHFSALETLALALIQKLRSTGLSTEFFLRKGFPASLHELAWQALPAVLNGKNAFIETNLRDQLVLPAWSEANDGESITRQGDRVRMMFGPTIREFAKANFYSDLIFEPQGGDRLAVRFPGKGYLQLEALRFSHDEVLLEDPTMDKIREESDGRLHSYKRVTIENLTEMDPTMSVLGFGDPETRQNRLKALIEEIMRPQLRPEVPLDVRRLFDYSRSMMIYGFFYYPIYTFASEQAWLLAEAAMYHRCLQLGIKEPPERFMEKVDELIKHGVIPSEEREQWDNLRHLRIYVAHKTGQGAGPPDMAIGALEIMAQEINRLFVSPYGDQPPKSA